MLVRNKLLSLGSILLALMVGGGCASDRVSPTGGSGGSAAGGMGGTAPASCGSDNPDDLISDFTDDNGLHPADGRSGGWYVFGDTAGTFAPPKNPDPTVAYPIDKSTGNNTCSGPGTFHVRATGFKIYGAALAVDFVPKVGTAKGAYDASKYKGVSFWAKATAPLSAVQVKFPDIYSDFEADPSKSDPTASACALVTGFDNNCSPYIVKLASPPDDTNYPKYVNTKIDATWRRFDIFFADAKQDKYNGGQKSPGDTVDVKHLVSFAIQVNANFTTNPISPNDFEIWLDDVRFIR
jgi:hypothetical protein